MTPGIIIKRYIDDAVLYEAPTAKTVKQAVEEAVRAGANLGGANLGGANLGDWECGANGFAKRKTKMEEGQ